MNDSQRAGSSVNVEAGLLDSKKEMTNVTFSLLQSPGQARPLGFGDFSTISNTMDASLKDDPLTRYLTHTKDHRDNLVTRFFSNLFRYSYLRQFMYYKTGWTFDDGDAFVCYSDPAKPKPWTFGILQYIAMQLLFLVRGPEENKRQIEVQNKMDAAAREALGDQAKYMINLANLHTIPAKQGRGYGTTLVKLVTAEADRRSLSTCLCSINVANTGFYNSLGFLTAKHIFIGEDNPAWHEPPVVIDLMVREPATPHTVVKEKSYVQETL